MKYVFGLFTGLVIGGVLGFLIHGAWVEIKTDEAIAEVRKEMESACEEKTQDALNDQKQEMEENFQLAMNQREQFWKEQNEMVRNNSLRIGFEKGKTESDRECSERVSKSEQRMKREYTNLLRDVRSTYKDADTRERRRQELANKTRGDPMIPDEYDDEVIATRKEATNPKASEVSTDQFVKYWFLGLGCLLMIYFIFLGVKKDFRL